MTIKSIAPMLTTLESRRNAVLGRAPVIACSFAVFALLVSINVLRAQGAASATGTLVPGRESAVPIAGAEPTSARLTSSQMTKARIKEINAARVMVRQYANCVLSTLKTAGEHRTLIAFLKTVPSTPESKMLSNKLKRPDCVSMNGADYAEIRLTDDLIRGGLVRALYVDTKRTPRRSRVLPEELAGGVPQGDLNFGQLRRFGTCVVAKQSADAERFVMSDVGSESELIAIRSLSPALNGCLVKGSTVHFSYGVMEGVLAEALYYQQNPAASAAPMRASN